MRRFIISIVTCVIIWLSVVIFLSFVLSDYMFSLIDVPSLSEHLKLLLILCATTALLIATLKTDFIFGEINYNLNPFKVIYCLMNDFKQKHKLNNENRKKLAILSRIIQILALDLGIIFIIILITLSGIKMMILSGKLFWTFFLTAMIPVFIIIATTGTTAACLIIIVFAYYTMIFGQINRQINLMSDSMKTPSNKIIISKRKEFQLISLINQHKLLAIEVHKTNLMLRFLASLFINFSIMKIILLYLLINSNEFIIKLFLIQSNILIIISGFGGSYLFT